MARPVLAAALALLVTFRPDPVVAQASAVIEGRVVLSGAAARMTAARYATGPAAAKRMQPVPAVVYLADPGPGDGPVVGVAGSVDIVQRDTVFAPGAVAVRTGTAVRFPNADPFFHNVYSYAGNARFDLGRYPEGESRQYVFRAPGIAHVFCEVHEFMRAVVLVTDHSFHAVLEEDGSFRMEAVPPGEHTFVAYHPDAGSLEQRLTVAPGETVRLELRLGS